MYIVQEMKLQIHLVSNEQGNISASLEIKEMQIKTIRSDFSPIKLLKIKKMNSVGLEKQYMK